MKTNNLNNIDFIDLYGIELFMACNNYNYQGTNSFSYENSDLTFHLGKKETGEVILLLVIDDFIVLSKPFLDLIMIQIGNHEIKLLTNAGVELHSSLKGIFKNIEVIKIPYFSIDRSV